MSDFESPLQRKYYIVFILSDISYFWLKTAYVSLYCIVCYSVLFCYISNLRVHGSGSLNFLVRPDSGTVPSLELSNLLPGQADFTARVSGFMKVLGLGFRVRVQMHGS